MNAKLSILILLITSVVLGLLRSGTSLWPTGTGEEKVRISFWNGFTGPDGRTMLQIIRKFNEANPNIEVTMQRMEWGIYYNKLMVAGIGGRGPEVFIITASSLPRIQRAGFIGNADALYTGTDGVPRDDYDALLLEQLQFNGHLVGLPMDVHPQGMFCNAEMLRQAGIVDASGQPHPPRTREEFLTAATQMKIDDQSNGRVGQWGFALTAWLQNFMALVPQFGGRYFDKAGHCVLDCAGNIEALEFLVSLLNDRHLIPEPETGLGWVGFRQQKVGMVFDGVYMLGDLLRLHNMDYLGTPLPQIGSHPGTSGDSHILCLRSDLEEKKLAAVRRFMRFIADHGLEWAGAGQIPARKSDRATKEFAGMKLQFAFARQLPDMVYPPRSPGLFEMQRELNFAVEKALHGRASSAEVLREARVNFENFMKNSGLPLLVDDTGKASTP